MTEELRQKANAELREKRIAELEITVGTLRTFSNEQATYIESLKAQIEKMRRCIICKHYSSISGCSYHSNWVKDCKENGMKLFELKEITEND